MVTFDIFAQPVRADHFSYDGNTGGSSSFISPSYFPPFQTVNVAASDVGQIQATYTSLLFTVVNFHLVSTSFALELQV
jgi:hypothetical protein